MYVSVLFREYMADHSQYKIIIHVLAMLCLIYNTSIDM
jgi:hypothetical protein